MVDNRLQGTNQLITLEVLADAYQQVQVQFNNGQTYAINIHNELSATRKEFLVTQENYTTLDPIQILL